MRRVIVLSLLLVAPVGFFRGLLAEPFAYIGEGGPANKILIVDCQQDEFVGTIDFLPGIGAPFGVVISPCGRTLYVSHDGNTVSVIDIDTDDPSGGGVVRFNIFLGMGMQPQGIDVSSDGGAVFVANSGSDGMSIVDPEAMTVCTVPGTGSSPQGVAVGPDGCVFITNFLSSFVSVFDPDMTPKVFGPHISLPIDPPRLQGKGICLSADGSELYVAIQNPDALLKINIASRVVQEIPLPNGSNPSGVAVLAGGSKIYVTNVDRDSVSVIDPRVCIILKEIDVGNSPESIAVASCGTKVYVVNSGSVSVIDTFADEVIRNICPPMLTGKLRSFGRFIIRGAPVGYCGVVNSGAGSITDVLFVNSSVGTKRRVVVPTGCPISVELQAVEPNPAQYVLWAWLGDGYDPYRLDGGNAILGTVVLPTPLQPFRTPQPFRCLDGGLPATFCAGTQRIAGAPARAPWVVRRERNYSPRISIKLTRKRQLYSDQRIVTLICHGL